MREVPVQEADTHSYTAHDVPQSRPHVVIWTDGSALGNPGPGGYGAVLLFVDSHGSTHRLELSQGYALTTNNRMELMAVIAALEALKRACSVELHSDSRYVINALELNWVGGWAARGWKTAGKKPVKNVDLWKRLISALRPHEMSYHWVKGHAGHELNERCDTLARSSASLPASDLLSDTGFEQDI